LALVSPEYFEFEKEWIQVIMDALCLEDFDQHRSCALQWGWVYLDQNKEALKKQFLECSNNFRAIDVSAKEKILKTLVEKTHNAWFRAEVEA
jgi:hypothetical protein